MAFCNSAALYKARHCSKTLKWLKKWSSVGEEIHLHFRVLGEKKLALEMVLSGYCSWHPLNGYWPISHDKLVWCFSLDGEVLTKPFSNFPTLAPQTILARSIFSPNQFFLTYLFLCGDFFTVEFPQMISSTNKPRFSLPNIDFVSIRWIF